MSPIRLLLGGAVVVVVVALLAAVAVPGALEEPDREPDGPGRLDVRDMSISAGEVSGETAELVVETRIVHFGPTAENVTVEFRAIDLESGLLQTTRSVAVDPIEGDREVPVNATLGVPRDGGYRLEAIVYHDGRRLSAADRRVEGVGSLQPPYAESTVRFHDFSATDQPAIEYRIAAADNETATLDVQTYLTNEGDEAAGGLRLVVKARQAESGIVADEAESTIGTIEPGRTETPGVELTVPDGYNYYLDAQLWADGVIVGEARSAANLDPAETLSVEETRREIGIEVSDFEERPGTQAPEQTQIAAETPGQPGFTVVSALIALLAALLLARRVRG